MLGHPVQSHNIDWDLGWNKVRGLIKGKDKRSTMFMGSECNIEDENKRYCNSSGYTSEIEASKVQSITLTQVNHWYKA